MIADLIRTFNEMTHLPPDRLRSYVIRVLVAQKQGWKVGFFTPELSREYKSDWGAHVNHDDFWVGRRVVISPTGQTYWFPSFDGETSEWWVWLKAVETNTLPNYLTLDGLFPIIGLLDMEMIFSFPTLQQAVDYVIKMYLKEYISEIPL